MWDQVGPKPLPTTEIESYLRLTGITDPDTQMKWLRLIRRMDITELEILNQKLARNRPAK